MHVQFVGELLRLLETGRAAEPDHPGARRRLALLDDAPGRVILVGQLDRGIDQRAAALVAVDDVTGHVLEPGAQLRQRIAGMLRLQPVPARRLALGGLPQIFRHQFVLGREVAVERHLVGAGRLRDRVDPDRPDSIAVEQLAGDREDALARRNSLGFINGYGRFRGHDGVSS